MYIRPVDERGWLVPKVGTKFREVYNMLCQGLKPREIILSFPETKVGNIRQMIFRIKNPRKIPRARPQWIMTSQADPSSLGL